MSGLMSTGALAEKSARRPWTTIIVWLLVVGLSVFAMMQLLGGSLTSEMKFTRAPESQQGMDLMRDRLTGPAKFTEIVVFSSEDMTVDDPAYRQQVQDLRSGIGALGPEQIESTIDYYQAHDESMVSSDRHSAIMQVVLSGADDQAEKNVVNLVDLTHAASERGGMTVTTTGVASTNSDSNKLAQADGQRTETVGILIALVILLIVFGTLVAAGLPVALAGCSIVVAMGITAFVGQAYELSFFVVNMITMMGLAVGIDYTLFVLSRYREELGKGRDKYEAIRIAGGTAGKSVLFSGMTVILALLGMLMIPMSIFISLGAGAIFVVGVAISATLTLLPATLSLLGHRVNAIKIPVVHRFANGNTEDSRFWNRTTLSVMKRPLLSVIAVVVLLAMPAAYYFQINTGASGIRALPDSFDSKKGFLALEKDFSMGLIAPVEVVVDGDINSGEVRQAMSDLQNRVKEDPDFYGSPQVKQNEAGDLAMIALPVGATAESKKASAAVERLRQDYVPAAFGSTGASVYVAGAPAINADYFNITDRYRPLVFAFVLSLSFILLTLVFRSLVVPIKAILMNLLSVGAAYGMLVLVFQKGVGASLFGFKQTEAIEAWLPLFLFSVLFGLSMDYHVFLIGRIRERYLETGDNSESVAFGLRSTGKIITGAALIMVGVFAGFASGQLAMFQQMGFGLAVAVLLDATLIRSVLVPASMKLLGDRNWYLPKWLEWLPDFQLEGNAGSAGEGSQESGGGSLGGNSSERGKTGEPAALRPCPYCGRS